MALDVAFWVYVAFVMCVVIWCLVTVGVVVGGLLSNGLDVVMSQFFLTVGTEGAVTLVSYPLATAIGGAFVAKCIDALIHDWSTPTSGSWPIPSYVWWALAAAVTFVGVPLTLVRLYRNRGALVIPGRLRDYEADPSSDNIEDVLDAIKSAKDGARKKLQNGWSWRRSVQAGLMLLVIALNFVQEFTGFPYTDSVRLIVILVALLLAQIVARPWLWRSRLNRLDGYREHGLRLRLRDQEASAVKDELRPAPSWAPLAFGVALGALAMVKLRRDGQAPP